MDSTKRKIVVPVNFTKYSENGLIYAIKIASFWNADIILLNSFVEPVAASPGIFEPYSYLTVYKELEVLEKEAEKNLIELKERLMENLKLPGIENVNIGYDIVHGFPATTILNYSKEIGAYMIIMGFEKDKSVLKFGNITKSVLENSKVPVIAVPEDYDAGKFERPENILYLTKIGSNDISHLEKLIEITEGLNSNIICLHACLGDSTEEEERKMKEIKKFLTKNLNISDVECGILETGDIVDGIIKFIKRRKIDILSMNAKKRNVFLKLFSSDFTERILHKTRIPLLVLGNKR